MQSMAIASVMPKIELKPMTVKEKITLNKDNVSAVAGLMFQGDKGKIEKLGQLIDFVNDMEYTVLFDGVDAEAFVSARGEDLASALVLRSDDSYSIYSDMYPNYYVDIKKEDLQSLAGENFQMPANVDPNKLTQAVMTPVMKMMTGVKFGEPEAVEETMFDTAFTSKTPINMTLKEMALLGLNCVKEIMDKLRLKGRDNFLKSYLTPAIQRGMVCPLYPSVPRHPRQKYLLTKKGMDFLKSTEPEMVARVQRHLNGSEI